MTETKNRPAIDKTENLGRRTWSQWPKYDAAAAGFKHYWYPVFWSRDVKPGKQMKLRIAGEDLFVIREASTGKVHAMRDRCPHRGVPLSDGGTQEFPGTFSCPYHGWTFDLETGVLNAVITDGPESPLCGKVFQKVYPVEERIGLVWVYVGDVKDEVPPVEADIPEELLKGDVTIGGRITVREANWRYGTENGYDEGHAKYLHRFSWLNVARRTQAPVASVISIEESPDGVWATRVMDEVIYDSDFPGLGKWPAKKKWWAKNHRPRKPNSDSDPAILAMDSPGNVSVRMPGCLRVIMGSTWVHYEWCIGVDAEHYRYVQLAVKFKGGTEGFKWKWYYSTFLSWIFHGQFTGQDERMVRATDAPPERLYRPDVSIIGWRRLAERARTGQGPEDSVPAQSEPTLQYDTVPTPEEQTEAV